LNKEIESKAASLTTGTSVTVVGKCAGINLSLMNKLNNAIYIEAGQIK
jgi:phosphoribosylformimino-5-aminoimidazole carboxamide ribonucleotide (ProFAR) isomerase